MSATRINLNNINELDLDFGVTLAATVAAGVTTVTGTFASGIDLQTDGVDNGDQSKLNLVAGTNITLTDDGTGDITIDATGGGGSLTAPVLIDTGDISTKGLEIKGSVGGVATPAFVQGATGFSSNANASATFGSPTTSGSCSVVAVSQSGFGHSGIAVTDTQGNTYTLVSSNTGNFAIYVFVATDINSGSTTVTATQTDGANLTLAIHEYSGVALAAPVETQATSTAFGSPPGPASVGPITTVNTDLLFTALQIGPGPSYSVSGFTPREADTSSGSASLFTADVVDAAGTYTPSWVSSSGTYGTYGVSVVALRSSTGEPQAADLLEFQDDSGTILSSVNGIGQFTMSTSAGSASNNPRTGTLNYNTSASRLEVYNGSAWVAV